MIIKKKYRNCLLIIVVLFCFSAWNTYIWAGEIHDAVVAGDLNKVKTLLEADSTLLESRDIEDKTPLNVACASRQAAIANYLLDKGADIRTKSYLYGYTPLLYASSYFAPFREAEFELVRHLIALGSDINVLGYNGISPLHRAAQAGNLKVAEFLLDHGADPNIYERYKNTPGPAYISGSILHIAINYGPGEEMARFLIERGARLNIKDAAGNTELHLAALKGYAELTRFFIAHGSDVNAINAYNHTPLYYAARHGHRSVADVLIAAGADKNTIVETNYDKAPQLTLILKKDETYIWYLTSGYAIKTKNHLLLFNPSAVNGSQEACLANGQIDPKELEGQKTITFISYQIGAEDLAKLVKSMPKSEFVLPNDLAIPNKSFSMGDIRVHTIPAVFGGLGYLVEADGIKIFFSGRHLSDNDALNIANYRKEIDFLKPFGPIDIALLEISSHRYWNEPAFENYHYLIDQLSPKAVYLMAGNVFEQLKKCADVLQARNIPVAYMEGGLAKGERFHYMSPEPKAH